MIPLALLPWRLISAGAAVAALAGWGWWGHRQADTARADHAATKHAWADERARLHEAAANAERASRQQEQDREDAQRRIVAEAQRAAARSREDAAAAAAAGVGLRERAAALAARCGDTGPDSAAATGGPAASAAGVVLADVLGRLEADGRVATATLDAARAAGLACERAYDSLN